MRLETTIIMRDDLTIDNINEADISQMSNDFAKQVLDILKSRKEDEELNNGN